MRDRTNQVSDDIMEIARDTLENKLLKNSAYFVSKVLGYSSKEKKVIVSFPDGTTRKVQLQNNKRFSESIKVGDNVLVINTGFPSYTLDKTYAILYNTEKDSAIPILSREDRLIATAADRIRGKYTASTEDLLERLGVEEKARQEQEKLDRDLTILE